MLALWRYRDSLMKAGLTNTQHALGCLQVNARCRFLNNTLITVLKNPQEIDKDDANGQWEFKKMSLRECILK